MAKIPSQRASTESLPHCDHAVCNRKGGTLTTADVDFVIRCLEEQQVIVKTADGKYTVSV